VFGDYEIWLAAENGMYLRHMQNEWTPTMEHLNMDWKESVQVEVVTYFFGKIDLVAIDPCIATTSTMCCRLLLLSME
jgi:hypothetical protein